MYRASSEGIAVAKPYGDSRPYDFLVQYKNRLLRVQVKSTFVMPRSSGSVGFHVIVGRSTRKGVASYSSDEIDFVAAFIAPVDVWYVIPVGELGKRHTIFFYPNGSKMPFAGLYERFREAWDLLKGENSCTAGSTS